MLKILAIFAVLIALLLNCKAGEFDHLGPAPTEPFATVFTNNITSFSTNLPAAAATFTVNLTNTFLADKAIYHTFHEVVSPVGTNTVSFVLYKSINNIDFVSFSTNTATLAAYTNFEVTVTGEELYFREITLLGGTNLTANIYYAGH